MERFVEDVARALASGQTRREALRRIGGGLAAIVPVLLDGTFGIVAGALVLAAVVAVKRVLKPRAGVA